MKLKNNLFVVPVFICLLAGCGGGGGAQTDEDKILSGEKQFVMDWGNGNVDGAMSFISPDYSQGGWSYNDVKNAISSTGRFTVSNYSATSLSIGGTNNEWAQVYVSFDVSAQGQSSHIEGWNYWHKTSRWLICGDSGRAAEGNTVIKQLAKFVRQ